MTYGSVCSGIEAPGLAWEPLGIKPIWFSEIEKFPSAVLNHHWPDVPNLGDFTSDESWQYMLDNPPDILFGGTPCQAFSVAGQRQSLKDDRGNLSLMFTRLWNELKARGTTYAIWENVPGVLNTPDNAFGCFLAGMVGEEHALSTAGGKWADAGCATSPDGQVAWRTLDTQFYGVPQRRRRVFAVVSGAGDYSPSEILFKPDSLQRDIEKGKEKGQDAAERVEASTYEASTGVSINTRTCIDARSADGPRRNQGGVVVGIDGEQNASIERMGTIRSGRMECAVGLNKGTDGALVSRDSKGIGTTIDDKCVIGFHARQTPVSASGKDLPLEAQGGQALYESKEERSSGVMVVRRLTPV